VIVAAAREIRMTIRGSLPNVAKNASDINKLGRITSPSLGGHQRHASKVLGRATPNRLIRVYDVINGRRLANDHVFVDAGPGTPDGLRSDVDGTLWCGWGMGTAELDGVFIYSPEGKLIGRIHLPERCANLCFGGAKHNRLFMAASKSLYSLYVNTQGAAGGEAGTMLSPRQVSLTPPRTEDPRERTRLPVCLLRDCRRRHRRLCASIRS
jgi:hypothetical protein